MIALMFGGFFRSDLDNTQNPNNDRLIFSKGHASPLFYSLYAAAGKLTLSDLLKYRKFESPLEGHPTLEFPYTEAPTGSLGQGLSIGLGMAIALQRLSPKSHKLPASPAGRLKSLKEMPRVYVLLGDGEMAEGSVWEAIQAASYHKVDNLVAILDVNRLGQSQPTMFEHHLEEYKKRFKAFGWKTIVVKNGHDLKEIAAAYQKCLKTPRGWQAAPAGGEAMPVLSESEGTPPMVNGSGKPTVIIAKTYKGYGIKLLQDKDNWHGKPLPKDLYEQSVKELGYVDLEVRGEVSKPPVLSRHSPKSHKLHRSLKSLKYRLGELVATRQAAGDVLTQLMYKYSQVVVLDGDVKNSLYTESTQKEYPGRFFEMFIAEQNMVGAATGMSRRGLIPFVTTFSAFMTRAYDQIRMAALAHANTKFIGSHAGVSIGEDGASQMGLEDLSMFRSIFGSTVLCPADAVSTQKLVEEMIKTKGISYLRVARPATPVIYDDKEKFPIGGCKIHKSLKLLKLPKKKVMIVAAGITLYEALKAQDILAKDNIETIVVDCYSIKPIDSKTIISLVQPPTFNHQPITNIITVEDHWYEGGLGDAVLNVFTANYQPPTNHMISIHKLAVTKLPHSGKPQELLDYEGISAKGIVSFVRSLLSS